MPAGSLSEEEVKERGPPCPACSPSPPPLVFPVSDRRLHSNSAWSARHPPSQERREWRERTAHCLDPQPLEPTTPRARVHSSWAWSAHHLSLSLTASVWRLTSLKSSEVEGPANSKGDKKLVLTHTRPSPFPPVKHRQTPRHSELTWASPSIALEHCIEIKKSITLEKSTQVKRSIEIDIPKCTQVQLNERGCFGCPLCRKDYYLPSTLMTHSI